MFEPTTSYGQTVCGIAVLTSSPTCLEEMEEQFAIEIKGDSAVPDCRTRRRHPHVHSGNMRHDCNPKHTMCFPWTED